MASTGLRENPQTGLFEDGAGGKYVRCGFDEDEPVFIEVTSNRWSASYAGREQVLDWDGIDLPEPLKDALKRVVGERLKNRSPYYLGRCGNTLKNLSSICKSEQIYLKEGFQKLGLKELGVIWSRLDQVGRSLFRSIYKELSFRDLAGADYFIGRYMESWKARYGKVHLRDVLEWDPHHGSLLAAEDEMLQKALKNPPHDEDDLDCAVRLFVWISHDLLKRAQQVLAMSKDALQVYGGRQYFLRIQKAKGQSGQKPGLWQVTKELAEAIQAYSERPAIKNLQNQYSRLLVFPRSGNKVSSWEYHGRVDVHKAKDQVKLWARRRGLRSLRGDAAGETFLNLTPRRLRHTGATAMAKQGRSRQEIQDVLEHDSPASAQAYVDCLASELAPVFERGSERMGEVFAPLRERYFFQGQVVNSDMPQEKPINIPIQAEKEKPAIVGSCGKTGACSAHPMWACYDGCPHFLAWKDGPHEKALAFVQQEYERWSSAEGGAARSKALKDFDRLSVAIEECIKVTKAGSPDNKGGE